MKTVRPYDPTKIERGLDLLHPYGRARFERLAEDLTFQHMDKKIPVLFLPFETWRHPLRQKHLAESSRGVTNAGPFQSPHQYGLAVDFVPFTEHGWTWNVPDNVWEAMHLRAKEFGLHAPIRWDKAHIEHPRWEWVWDALRY